jgi:molybdenum cofactor biosynthesis enzyme MoaA
MASLNVFQWLRYGPWLAQVVVTRRCNLKYGYCAEYDRTSDPVPYDELTLRLAKLAELRAWAVCLTGGEPTMHPRLSDAVPGWTSTRSNQADVGSISWRSGTW